MHCHKHHGDKIKADVLLVGNPNVGKSVIFHALTGKYATVSNYPGTTVDIHIGKIKGTNLTLVDTPGMYSFFSITEEERIAKKIIIESDAKVIVNVVEAKNLERSLPLTLQLIEMCKNVILVLNAMDEAKKFGIEIDVERLEERLGIPIIKTIAIKGEGIDKLREEILKLTIKLTRSQREVEKIRLELSEDIEKRILEIENKIVKFNIPKISKRFLAILLLSGDQDVENLFKDKELNYEDNIDISIDTNMSIAYKIAMEYQKLANKILDGVIEQRKETFNDITLNPIFSIPMAILALYFIYFFAGVLGAQMVVDIFERYFEILINTPLNEWLKTNIKYIWLRELIGGEYGIITLGIRYAVVIVLPIVFLYFIAFSIIEDSGYLPRLAVLLNGLFKRFGLSGRAVIPLMLGFGCGTMATIVTRVLETKRERMIAVLLLAIAIPCSAQFGIILGISPDFKAITIWAVSIFVVMLLIGSFAERIIPGERPIFFIELPPLRYPSIKNVFLKTFSRMRWYFSEVLPIFILISILIWIGKITGLLQHIIKLLSIPTSALGLPKESAQIFLYGFFRRDYGSAGLYDLISQGILTYRQIIVSMVVLTLFVPCIAQLSVMIKERGFKFSFIVFMSALVIAFSIGFILNSILEILG